MSTEHLSRPQPATTVTASCPFCSEDRTFELPRGTNLHSPRQQSVPLPCPECGRLCQVQLPSSSSDEKHDNGNSFPTINALERNPVLAAMASPLQQLIFSSQTLGYVLFAPEMIYDAIAACCLRLFSAAKTSICSMSARRTSSHVTHRHSHAFSPSYRCSFSVLFFSQHGPRFAQSTSNGRGAT